MYRKDTCDTVTTGTHLPTNHLHIPYNRDMKQVTREQLIIALIAEDEFMRHDMDCDDTPEEFAEWVNTLTYEELLTEACIDDEYFTLEEFMAAYGA